MPSRDEIPFARFPLPEDWQPDDIVCAIVPIPDDPQYLEQLIGLLDRMRDSTSFERDETKTGAATVARTWKRALLSRPIVFGECEVTDCCDDPIVVVPPYVPGGTGPDDAAAAALTNIHMGLINLLADCTMTRQEFINAATTYMRTFDPSYSAPGPLGNLYDQYCPLSDEAKEAYQEECAYIAHKDQLKECYGDTGLIDDLNCLSDTITEWLADTSDAIMTALNEAAAALTQSGWQAASGGGGGGFGGGFGAECNADWCHEVDLMTETPADVGTHYTFEIVSGGYDAAGFKNFVDLAGSDPDINRAWLKINFDGLYEITVLEIQFTSANSQHADYEIVRMNTQHGTFQGQPFNEYETTPWQHLVHTPGATLTGKREAVSTAYVEFWLLPYVDPITLLGQLINVQRFKICGIGPNPFAP